VINDFNISSFSGCDQDAEVSISLSTIHDQWNFNFTAELEETSIEASNELEKQVIKLATKIAQESQRFRS
jgi:hypothetical protein